MNHIDAAVTILIGMGIIDGTMADGETKYLNEFCKGCVKNGIPERDVTHAVETVCKLQGDGFKQKFVESIEHFRNNADIETRVYMLDFMFNTIASDGNITPEEEDMFWEICDFWQIDRQKYLEYLKSQK